MKFDEKTGKPIPENRQDEIRITLERLNEIREKTNGFNDKQTEICTLLGDISVSNALIVDILGALYNYILKKDKGEETNDECPAEDTGSVD